MKTKAILLVLGPALILMGAFGLVPDWGPVRAPVWYSLFLMVAGLVAVSVPAFDIAPGGLPTHSAKSRIALMLAGAAMCGAGAVALIPGLRFTVEPAWHAAAVLGSGAVSILIAFMEKEPSGREHEPTPAD